MKTKKPVTPETGLKSSGMKLVAKYRPRMSRLTDTERQKLMARGMQIMEMKAFDVEMPIVATSREVVAKFF